LFGWGSPTIKLHLLKGRGASYYYLDFVWAESPEFYLRLNQVGKEKEDP
jgi:hypothetical protein